jgi:hypothetical protein
MEQMIEIIGWLGGERRAERQGNGERSHRAPSSFSIALYHTPGHGLPTRNSG